MLKGVMNTPTQDNHDAIALIRSLSAGKPVDVVLACGAAHRFEPCDLLHNQEAVLLFAGIEQLLSLHLGLVVDKEGNAELSAELGVPSAQTPSLSGLLDLCGRGRCLPGALISELYDLKALRNSVLHGSLPLFINASVDNVRKAYGDLRQLTCLSPSTALESAIKIARSNRLSADAAITPSSYALLADLLEMVDIERSIRQHLISSGMKVEALLAVECAHELLKHLKTQHLAKGLVKNLRKVFILRNHIAHGLIFGLTAEHRALVRKTSADLHVAISATNLAKSGGRMALGDGFTNSALALGLTAMVLG